MKLNNSQRIISTVRKKNTADCLMNLTGINFEVHEAREFKNREFI